MNKEIVKIVRDILINEWDPIGISGTPNAEDEYDSYLYDIVSYINKKSNYKEIFDFLCTLQKI